MVMPEQDKQEHLSEEILNGSRFEKVESFSGNNQISTFGLTKALFYIVWKEVVITGLLGLASSLSSFVGPYLLDAFVQYLNGHQDYKNQEPIYNLPDSISVFFQTKVSLDRIATYLRLPHIDSNAIEKVTRGSSDMAVEIINGNFAWYANASSSNMTLKDINIKVNHGMRVAVCGTVGSGKSSLLSCILGEVSKISGSVKVEGKKAYVAQSPWIQSGKIEDNILFGREMDRERSHPGAHKEALSAIDSMGTTVQEGTTSSKKNTTETQNGKTDDISSSKAQLVQEEEREKGKVGFSVYWKYITTAYGGALAPFIVLAQVLFESLQIGSNYWMAWGSPVSESDPAPVTGSTLIMVYVALAFGCALCILARGLLLATVAYKAATILFHKMHLSIFRSPMSFFDSTPSGRILNRASTDQSAVDMQIPYQVGSFVIAIIQLLCIMAIMSQAAWQVIIIFIPVGIMCIWLQQYYLPSAREMARLVGVCKGPVIQNFAETISGSTTIRSFDQQGRFEDTNLKLNDDFARPKLYAAAAMEWLGIRLDMLSSFTFAVFLIFLISIPEGTIDPSIAGLAATYGLTLNTLQGWAIWTLTNLENNIISVERIFQYSSLPSEPPLVIESNRPDDHWPSQGEIDIHPTMFEGTIRSNLDPLEEYTDDKIWEALDKCQLGDEVRSKEGKLDSLVTENGENWSVGQRQLVCLGRVLLKKTKVLVLDEATASVDTATDGMIQQTLARHFTDSTVIMIAHRITSVLDSDMVLVLEQGLIDEYNSPTKLLEDKSSSFAKLVAEYSMRSNSSFEN
ncbi:hypothetical protein L1887_39214 [Cichorium endivia]|nr:hypothetical protein L1887_39214 [Cichorium endivia]